MWQSCVCVCECVWSYCMLNLCVVCVWGCVSVWRREAGGGGGRRRRRRRRPGIQNQKQEPHTKLWGNKPPNNSEQFCPPKSKGLTPEHLGHPCHPSVLPALPVEESLSIGFAYPAWSCQCHWTSVQISQQKRCSDSTGLVEPRSCLLLLLDQEPFHCINMVHSMTICFLARWHGTVQKYNSFCIRVCVYEQ